jgi:hypothetical protein
LIASKYRTPALLFAGVFLFSGLSPVSTSFDSRWTVYIAMSMWRHGDTNLDEYPAVVRASGDYALECVDGSGHVRADSPEVCNGHWYSRFPIGGTALAAPLIVAMVEGIHVLQPVLAHVHSSRPVVEAFLHGDFDLAHPLIEMEAASLLLAAAAVMIYFISRLQLPAGRAVILALLFALATSAYSTGGRALWQHTPSMLLLTIAIYLLLRAEERPSLAAWAGIPVALSYMVRPTDGLFVVVLTGYVAVRHRGVLLRYLLAAAPIAALFLAYNFSIYRALLSPYYRYRVNGFEPSQWPAFGKALAANLVSPSRGLLVFTPVFLFAIWSMLRGKWRAPISPWLAALACCQWLAVSAFVQNWWAGHSYGPRFLTDITPIFVLFLIPYFEEWDRCSRSLRVIFATLALLGLAIHLRGGWSAEVYQWNVTPVNIDRNPDRAWDWRDPQFLRGIESGSEKGY